MDNHQPSAIRVVAIRRPFALFESRIWRPSLNVYETEQGVQVVAELAGIVPEELLIHIQQNQMLIQGKRQIPTPGGLRRLQRLEIASGPFHVEVLLTTAVDSEHAEARYEQGLLTIWLPYAQERDQRVVVIRLGEKTTP